MQDIDYSEALNAYRTTIRTPFWKASFMLGWPLESAGFGIAKHLVDKCLERKADLIVFSEYDQTDYRMEYSVLVEVLRWNTEYYKGVQLHVLPMNYFTIFKQEEAETCKCHCCCQMVVQTGYFLCPKCVGKCLQ